MDLGKQVLDKELIDRDGRRAGKVDDLLLEIEPTPDGRLREPKVVAIMSGPLALSQDLSRPVAWFARLVYHLLGLADPHPVEIPWERVSKIDVAVHVDVERQAAGLTALADAVDRRFIARIPGA